MRAEIIAVGSELLLFGRRDTNAEWLSARMTALGLDPARRTLVGDDEEEIAEAIAAARGRASWVVVTGGLGPTADDRTREALALALGTPLRIDPALRETIAARLAARGFRSLRSAEIQARVPDGMRALPNPAGSAPGLVHEGPPCWIAALPGVPLEMQVMFEALVERWRGTLPGTPPKVLRLLVSGLSESEVDERLKGLIGILPEASVTILAGEEGIELLLRGRAGDGEADVSRIETVMRERLGAAVVGGGDVTLAGAVGTLLERNHATLAVAESCTGGLLGATITSVPGASAWFLGGFVAYADALKTNLLEVPGPVLAEHGAVSEPAARAMAEGARRRTGSSYALSITGIAGPDGGTEDKPVGLVHVALAGPAGTTARRLLLGGGRKGVRSRSVAAALDLLRRSLLEEGRT